MSNIKFATFRLGKTSVQDIQDLDKRPAGVQRDDYSFIVTCTQIPDELTVDTVVFIWLGSDNSKGMPTEWKQGFKGVGIVKALNKGEKYSDESQTTIQLKYVFAESVNRLDVLRENPSAYYYCSDLPIIGLDDHSNQTARMIEEKDDRSRIGAFLCAINSVNPSFREEIEEIVPGINAYFWTEVPAPKELSIVIKIPDNLSLDELASELKLMSNDSDTGAASYRILGLKYPESIEKSGVLQVLQKAGLSDAYMTEINKGRKLHELIKRGKWGMSFTYRTINVLHLSNDLSYQIINYGAPGTGKSDDIKQETANETVFRTTFHPDSDYASFVGAYKPIMKTDGVAFTEVSRKETGSGQFSLVEKHDQRIGIAYEFVEQVFTKAYIKAWEYQKIAKEGETPKRVYLVIEEINRGNCAQVFGDLFQLLDRNQNGFSEYAIQLDSDFGQYIAESMGKIDGTFDETRKTSINALYPEAEDGVDMVDEVLAGRLMLLPNNLFIRATMNTSDQSLFPMDSAFKRRWDWKYVAIKDHPEKNWVIEIDSETHYSWWDFLKKINKEIQDATSSEDKQLGYFFIKAKDDNTIDLNMFVNKVVFYLWNSVFKDCYTDCEFMKQDTNSYFTFTGFFDKDGKPDAKQAKAFLGKFKGLKSLEEKKAEEKKKVEESIASSGEDNDTGNSASAKERISY